jgi:hypothetical protein
MTPLYAENRSTTPPDPQEAADAVARVHCTRAIKGLPSARACHDRQAPFPPFSRRDRQSHPRS